jgi:hypothetical protein
MGRRALTQQQFIAKARAVHGDRYDYSRAIYTGGHINLTIVCREHGEFYPQPTNHLQGTGCPQCANAERSANMSAQQKGEKRGEYVPRRTTASFGGMVALPFWSK